MKWSKYLANLQLPSPPVWRMVRDIDCSLPGIGAGYICIVEQRCTDVVILAVLTSPCRAERSVRGLVGGGVRARRGERGIVPPLLLTNSVLTKLSLSNEAGCRFEFEPWVGRQD